MNSQNLVLVSFNRDQLQMVEFEGQPYVVMKPIVKSLKLDWEHNKLSYWKIGKIQLWAYPHTCLGW